MDKGEPEAFFVYDTLTREKQRVFAEDGETLRFYCCGPTVYGPAHIGNFRTFIAQDLFRRVAECSGMKTMHVRNITDVDDKTIRDSRAAGKKLDEFTSEWRGFFENDCNSLGLLTPHEEPSAVLHIPQQIKMIEDLFSSGHAYLGEDGSVYFRISSFENYGKLSGLDKREVRTAPSGETMDRDEYSKEDLRDFALWKARREEDGENFWNSPWGEGRPGWHLECSAMCREYLGDSFDMHSGGEDLVFPHHENEIAQSECSTGKAFARHWFHIAHLMVDGGKMSKSLNNMYTLSDLQAKGFVPEAIRYLLLSGHYRQSLNFTLSSLDAASGALAKLKKFDESLGADRPADYSESVARGPAKLGPFEDSWKSLLDDLNSPKALGELFGAIREINLDPLSFEEKTRIRDSFWFILHAFGLKLASKDQIVEPPKDVKELAESRMEARKLRDWGRADELREQVAEKGWAIKDLSDGYELTQA